MRRLLMFCSALIIIVSATYASTPPRIQLALMLDTSGSMDGLIDQARSQLWKVVSDLANARRNGARPRLELALYEYGNQGLLASDGYLRMVSDFTTDLDLVSERLHALRTNGGEEYCGTVILTGVNDLRWSADPSDLRLIVIAGNEPFDQGRITPEQACKAANAKGITITTLYCGNDNEGRRTGWEDGGRCSGGSYWAISIDKPIAHISTPFDTTLARLNQRLNTTYHAYGRQGAMNKARQDAQDANAMAAGAPVMAERASAKATTMYGNAAWDLVDLYEADERAFRDLPNEQLPVEWRRLSKDAREDHVRKLKAQRAEIQREIARVDKLRRDYVANEERRQTTATPTIDRGILQGIRTVAMTKAFVFVER